MTIAIALPADAQLSIDGEVIAGGGGRSNSAGGCLVLDATLGQPATGTASGGAFSIAAGYWAGVGGVTVDTLFNQGFEECQ